MSGVVVIRYLLANNAAVLAALGAGPPGATWRIVGGDLPLGTVMPAISIAEIGSIPRNTVKMNQPRVQHTERVQVSVLVKGPDGTPPGTGLPGVKALLKLVLAACPHTHGMVNGIDVDQILPDIQQVLPQDDPTSLYSGSRDFFVKWNSP